MKCSLSLTVSPFLLLILLLGSASTLPLVDPSTQLDPRDEGNFLDVDPRVQLIPVIFEFDPYSSEELEEDFTGGRPIEEEVLSRKRRQTTVSGGANTEDLGQGARRNSGHVNLEHTSDKHTFLSGLNLDHTRVPGLGSSTNVGVQGGYQYKPNENTAFSVGASHSRGVLGFGEGVTRNSGNVAITHSDGKHSFTAGVGADKTSIPGFGSSSNVNANVGYEYKLDKVHSLTFGGSHSRGDSGRSNNNAFVQFGRRFR